MKLTKDADKLACLIYKSYLSNRQSGIPKNSAKQFSFNFSQDIPELHSWLEDDIDETLDELKRVGFIQKYIDGGFKLQDDFIVYMESRFKNGLLDVIDVISKFIP